MDLHRIAEERSVAFHELVSQRMQGDPAILERARARVDAWCTDGTVHSFYVEQWRTLLAQSPLQVGRAITERSEEASALRQVTPFAGAISPQERWKLWRDIRRRFEPAP